MRPFINPKTFCLTTLLYSLAFSSEQGDTAPPLFWCPNRTADQQYSATAEPGCVPLAESQVKTPSKGEKPAGAPALKPEDLQSASGRFLDDYRRFLACCATDPNHLEDIDELDARAGVILKTAQTGLFSEKMKLRGFVFSEIIPPVARAKTQLNEIRTRLEQIQAARENTPNQDLEAGARARHRIEDLERSITQDFTSKSPPVSPKTGTEIGETPPSGPRIGKVPPTGTDFGTQGRTGIELGYTPTTTGKGIGQNAPTGFEIGQTGAVGPSIGESDLNRRPSGVSSSIEGSSVSSNLTSSPLGSELTPSAVGSDLQSRPTPPSTQAPLSTIGSTLQQSRPSQ